MAFPWLWGGMAFPDHCPRVLNRLEELAQIHCEARDGGTGQPSAGTVKRALGEFSFTQLAVDLDLFLPPQHQPGLAQSVVRCDR